MIYLALFFLIPNIVTRYVFLKKNKYQLIGFLQDIFLLCQKLFLFYFFCPFAIVLICIFDIYLVLDGLIYSHIKSKMQLSFLFFFKEIKSFQSSIDKKIIMKTLTSISLLVLYYLIFFSKISDAKEYLSINTIIVANIVFFFISFGSLRYLKKRNNYFLVNIIIEEELQGFIKILSYIKSFFYKSKNTVFSNEQADCLYKKYFLLRKTNKYIGHKLFNIDIQKHEKPNIIFYIMESFRSKDINVLGGKYNVSSQFDALSKEGVLFKNFYSTGCFTNRALLASLFGIYTSCHKMPIKKAQNCSLLSLAQILKDKNYKTSCIYSGHFSFENLHEFFYKQGFDNLYELDDIKKQYPDGQQTSWGMHDEHLVHYSIDYLKKNKNRSNFLTLVPISNHHPWIAPDGYKIDIDTSLPKDYQNYLHTFSYSDKCLGQFIRMLRENNLIKDSIVFIFGDHGQNMDENQGYLMQPDLSEKYVHVPLLILAENRLKPVIIDQVASQVDLAPTIMDMLNIQSINHNMGTSLLRKTNDKIIYFNDHYNNNKIGCIKNNFKYCFNETLQKDLFFDLTKNKEKDIAKQKPKLVKEYKKYVKDHIYNINNLYTNKLFAPKKFDNNNYVLAPGKNIDDIKLLSLLRKKQNIYILNLSECTNLSEEGFIKAASFLKNLIKLNVKNCYWVSEKSIHFISKNLKDLVYLNIADCVFINDFSIEIILSNLTKLQMLIANSINIKEPKFPERKLSLRYLKLFNNNNLSGCTLINFLKQSPFLQAVFFDATKISNEELLSIKDMKKTVRSLHITNGAHIHDEALFALINNSYDLKELYLEDMSIKDDFLKKLQKIHIKHLSLLGCPNITDKGLLSLKHSTLKCLWVIFNSNVTRKTADILKKQKDLKCFFQGCINVSLYDN